MSDELIDTMAQTIEDLARWQARAEAAEATLERVFKMLNEIVDINNHEPDCNQSGEFLDAREIAEKAIRLLIERMEGK